MDANGTIEFTREGNLKSVRVEMKKNILIVTLLLLILITPETKAGVVLGSTRVIYDSDKNDVTLTLSNTRDEKSYLVQSWISTSNNDSTRTPFIITPPLFKLSGGKKSIIRIINVDGNLPEDKESLFWINVKSIPATEQNSQNQLQVVIKSKLKLIYRPIGLIEAAESAYEKLEIKRNADGIDLYNPTPIYINLFRLDVDDKNISEVSMVPPKSHIQVRLTKNKIVHHVTWQAIDDSGALYNSVKKDL